MPGHFSPWLRVGVREPRTVGANDGTQHITIAALLARTGGARQSRRALAACGVAPRVHSLVGRGRDPVVGIVAQGQESIVGLLSRVVIELPPVLPHNGVSSGEDAVATGRNGGVELGVGLALVILATR